MKRVVFLTGTRADFGKLKPLIKAVEADSNFESHIFATGMHTLSRYGYTVDEIHKTGFSNVHVYINQTYGEPLDQVLANTVAGLSRYVREIQPDLLVIHGDRAEALAGAIVGSFNNLLVGHIEGGELSGTLDELIRHAVSKLSHVHFVANEMAAGRLKQMGELPQSIFVIGSPDIDVMLSPELPSKDEVIKRYQFRFDDYAVLLFHPVVTELNDMRRQAETLVAALIESGENYVVVYSNNDEGSNFIFDAYERIQGHERFHLYPSIRFEFFLSLLKHARFLIGNSSAGIREAPVYGLPCINIGTRQLNRFEHESINTIPCERQAIIDAIKMAGKIGR